MDARLTLLLACFFLSGFAALLYQTAWTRELGFVFGTSDLAVAAVLAAYMGGLALGAAAAARLASRIRRPVLAYGVLELAIALCALAVPVGIQGLLAVYVGLLGGASELTPAGEWTTVAFQLGAAFAVLLPPTAFMGATLPLLARHAVRSEEEIGSRVGLLYAVNTTGAIAGTLCAAFWLMPELGLRRTVWAGAGLNAVVFALAALLARRAPLAPPSPPTSAPVRAAGASWILPAIALSGAVSFAYEVLWTRLLGHLLGASLQAFATMLASFLLGIALGSAVAARLASSRERAALGFGVAQLGIAATSYAAFALADRLPELALRLGAGPAAPLASAAIAAAALLPVTLSIGATFPFAVRLLARHPEEAAGATARVYAWNTVGAIAGSLGAGFALLPALGFEGTLAVGAAANLALVAVTAMAARPRRAALFAAACAAGAALVLAPLEPPWKLLGSSPLSSEERGDVVYAAVGRSTTVMLFDQGAYFRLTTNGLPESTIDRKGVLQRTSTAHWLGLLPAILRPEARDLLVVGLGGGAAIEAVPSTVERIDVIELEPEVLAANLAVAGLRARDPLGDPRVRVHLGDARGALQLTSKRYDAIVSQPSHPWTAGASHLYTSEFFELVRSHLEPGGIFVQWIGFAFVDEDLLRSLVATLAGVFAHVELYQPEPAAVLFAASDAPIAGLDGARRALLAAPDDLARAGIHRVEDVASVWALDDIGARSLADGAPRNTDDDNRLASRAVRIGGASLRRRSVRPLFAPRDPLREPRDGLDRLALVRALLARGHRQRAAELSADGPGGAAAEIARGWFELARGRAERGEQHFERAARLAPGDSEARTGLVASRRAALAERPDAPGLAEADLDEREAAFVAAWEHARAREWDRVAELDATLARFAPGEALFERSARLRAQWRVAQGDPEACVQAMGILEARLVRGAAPADALLYAEAAIIAGRLGEAEGSIRTVLNRLPRGAAGQMLLRSIRRLSDRLPEEVGAALRAQVGLRVVAPAVESPSEKPDSG